jgi:8-oxo-dGTP pyrophosphatase MutT (NUDIX family)
LTSYPENPVFDKEKNKMTEVSFYEQAEIDDSLLAFAVIIARSEGKWVFCRHRERDTWEVPGGHREPGETILETARRELQEETGAIDFHMEPVCVYSVKGKTAVNKKDTDESFGMLFVANIHSFENELHSEIKELLLTDRLADNWTYPAIQPKLLDEAVRRGCLH